MYIARLFRKGSDFLSLGLFQIAKLGAFCMMLLVTVDVVGRYVIGRSTGIADEVSGYLLVLVAFFSMAETLKKGRHLKLDLITKRLSPRLQFWLDLVLSIIGLGGIGAIFWRSILLVHNSYVQGTLWPSILGTPLYIPQLFMPIGLFALILQCVLELCNAISTGRKLP